MTFTYESAERLATAAHTDTRTQSGSRFIDHARRVAAHFDPDADGEAAVAAILHDTVEKGTFEFEDLRRAGVDEHIIEIVDALTQRTGETERDYLARCAAHPVAVRIKRVDIEDKMHTPVRGTVDPARAVEIRRTAQRRFRLLESLVAEQPAHPASARS